jgi:hypothetical protein
MIVWKWGLNGNANALVWPNGTWWWTASYVDWKSWQAGNFTTTNYINCGNNINIEWNEPFTKTFWHKTTDNRQYYQLLTKQQAASPNRWLMLEMNYWRYCIQLYVPEWVKWVFQETVDTWNNWNWNYVTITYNWNWQASWVSFYINWNLVAKRNSTTYSFVNQWITTWTILSTSPRQINWRFWTTDSCWVWLMDEVEIHNTALTPAEIKNKYLFYNWFI